MAHFRVFYFTRLGRIQSADILDLETDQAAIEAANRLFAARTDYLAGYELWEGTRLVHRKSN